jgi:hypothetical protein
VQDSGPPGLRCISVCTGPLNLHSADVNKHILVLDAELEIKRTHLFQRILNLQTILFSWDPELQGPGDIIQSGIVSLHSLGISTLVTGPEPLGRSENNVHKTLGLQSPHACISKWEPGPPQPKCMHSCRDPEPTKLRCVHFYMKSRASRVQMHHFVPSLIVQSSFCRF